MSIEFMVKDGKSSGTNRYLNIYLRQWNPHRPPEAKGNRAIYSMSDPKYSSAHFELH